MRKMVNRKQLLKDIIETQVSEQDYKRIEIWKQVYAGNYDGHLKESTFTIEKGKCNRTRSSLRMAKLVSEELAKLVFTEKVEINVGNATQNEYINDTVLDDNRFYKEFQSKVEIMLALGGGVLKVHPEETEDGYKVKILYINPENFIPISWDNGDITEGVFMNVTQKRDKTYVLLEFHQWEKINNQETGEPEKVLVISNELYELPSMSGASININSNMDMQRVPLTELYEDLEERVIIEGIHTPLFRYMKSGQANNFNLESPLGISIFANAMDTLYALDVAFDSFIREFKLGKRRIIVPAEALRIYTDPDTGEQVRYFDADDEAYVGLKYLDPEKQKVMDNTVDIRAEDHIKSIEALLNILAMQLGMSPGTFVFNGAGLKTATEVISENSKTYQTIVSITNSIEESLEGFIRAILDLSVLYDIIPAFDEDPEISIVWDDSIIGDKYTDSDYYIKLNINGLISKRSIMRKFLGMTDEQIEEELRYIKEEQMTMTPDINDILNADRGNKGPQQIVPPKDDEGDDEEEIV